MPIGKSLVQARGLVTVKTTIREKPSGRTVVEKNQAGPIAAVAFDKPHAAVTATHSVTSSINYQTVVSSATVTLPVEATDAGISKGFSKAWALVEQELADRAFWAKEVLETLGAVHDKASR